MQTPSGHVLGLDFAERTGTLCVDWAQPSQKEKRRKHPTGLGSKSFMLRGVGLVLHFLKFRGTKCKSFN